MKKIPIIVIAGATASGKTALSIELAKRFSGEIVSADSMQIYKYMNIGTAKPDEEEKQGIPHHLMDFIDPFSSYSVADYVRDAKKCIDDIIRKNHLPIIVGGTGLYINSLADDIDFDETQNDEKIRDRLWELYKNEGGEALMKILGEIDPKMAECIHIKNTKRIIRAIEFYELTGKKISEHNAETKQKESRYLPLFMMISHDREKLYERIEKRVDIMIENGLIDEVMSLKKMGTTKKHQSMQGIGYKQILDYIRGFSTFEEAIRIIKRDSRRYAKRQLTWFRRNKDMIMLDANDDVIEKACLLVREFLSENDEKFLKIIDNSKKI